MPATFWAIVGYFIQSSSTRVDGSMKTLGQILGFWALVISGFVVLAGAYVSMAGLCSVELLLQCWNGRGA